MTKMTKREMFNAIINYVTNDEMAFERNGETIEVSIDDIVTFANTQIEALDKQAERARTKAKEKREQNDELLNIVFDALSDEYEPIADIAERVMIEVPDTTVAKITYRLRELFDAGKAIKTDIKVPGADGKKARTVKGYKRA